MRDTITFRPGPDLYATVAAMPRRSEYVREAVRLYVHIISNPYTVAVCMVDQFLSRHDPRWPDLVAFVAARTSEIAEAIKEGTK